MECPGGMAKVLPATSTPRGLAHTDTFREENSCEGLSGFVFSNLKRLH